MPDIHEKVPIRLLTYGLMPFALPIRNLGNQVILRKTISVCLASLLVLVGCGGGGSGGSGPAASSCGPYPEQATSLYVLPYEVGTGHEMVHGNCTTPGTSLHRQYSGNYWCPTVVIPRYR